MTNALQLPDSLFEFENTMYVVNKVNNALPLSDSLSEFGNTMQMENKVNNALPLPDSLSEFGNIMHVVIKWTISYHLLIHKTRRLSQVTTCTCT